MSNDKMNLNQESQQRIQDAAEAIKRQRMAQAQALSDKDNEMSRPIPSREEGEESVKLYSRKKDKTAKTDVSSEAEKPVDFSEPVSGKQGNNRIAVNRPVRQQNNDDFVDISDMKKASAPKKPRPKPEPAKIDSRVIPRTNNKKKTRKKLTKRVAISIVSCLVALVMLISGTGCLVMYSYLNSINYEAIDQSSVGDTKAKQTQTSGINTKAYEGKLLNDKQILNILLIGADTRKGQTKGLSDTMILFSIDNKHRKLKMLSFQRDTWVVIPGYGENKLNSSFTLGGAELTVKTIQANYGIQIDRYAIVDFNSFKKIIDRLGGIDIELTQEEVDYIDWQTWSNNQADTRNELDAYSYTYTPNDKGQEVALVHLNGRQALWHARNRGEEGICSGDDYTRTQRQRNVISIMINQIKKSETTKILETLSDIGSMLTTNLKSSEIVMLAQGITKFLKYEIVSQSAPDYENYDVDYWYSDMWERPVYVNGDFVAAILIIDWQDFRGKIADYVFNDVNRLKKSEDTENSDNSDISDDSGNTESTDSDTTVQQ